MLKKRQKNTKLVTNTVVGLSTRSSNILPFFVTMTTKFEEMMKMDHEGSSADLDDDGDRPDFRYVAWLLREKLNVLVDGDQGGPPGYELQSLLNLVASRKIISVDPKMLNPIRWRSLPKELLVLVFARLPVPDITRLRSLSREWNRDMATVNSDINRALDETSPTMVALISSSTADYSRGDFLVTICDLSKHKSQYSYTLHMRNPYFGNLWETMGAIDGGLVCFVSTWKPTEADPLSIVVMNLLTQDRHELPRLHYLYYVPPTMVHIKVDSETKCYKVVVVGKHIKGRPTIEMYDSDTKKWTRVAPPCGSIFGLAHRWHHNRTFMCRSITAPSVYDFAEGQLKYCDEQGPSKGASVIKYARHQDCMFVLHKNTSNGEMLLAEGHCITKYCYQTNAKDWIQERSYLCSPFEDLLEKCPYWMWKLKACEGFLMVILDSRDRKHFWFMDLSTGEWSSHPNCFEAHQPYPTFMSRAFWNVVP